MADSIADIVKIAAPVATIVGSTLPMFSKTPKMPSMKTPAIAPTPTMPTPNDASAKAAALKAIATRASQHGRQSTDLTNRETLG